MLRLFQVNEGRYLDVEAELTPNSRSREVMGRGRASGNSLSQSLYERDVLALY